MKRYAYSAWMILAVFCAFWAYVVGDHLIREVAVDLTVIDVGVLFVLGLIGGFALGQIRWRQLWNR